jgi:diguanylate cyclase (GGDEF)-like protein
MEGLIHTWPLAGVVGVGLTTAVVMRYLDHLSGRRVGVGLWLSWLMVAAAPIVGAQVGSRDPHGAGGALLVGGLLLLAATTTARPPEKTGPWIGWSLLIVVVMAAVAVVLPGAPWQGLYGVGLLLTVIFFASRGSRLSLGPVFNVGIVLIGLAACGLLAGSLRPSFWPLVDGAVGVLVFGGLVALAVAGMIEMVTSRVESYERRLSDLEEDHEHLLRLSEADPLTGCPTRTALRAWFERWDGSQPVSVVLIDVDNLKKINERHGHSAGDEALQLVANTLAGSIRPGDLVVRWGGDEFVAVLRGADHEAAKRRFTGLISALQESTEAFPYDDPLRVDWGVSSCSSPTDISQALAEADERMFAMKRRR